MTTMRPTSVGDVIAATERVADAHFDQEQVHRAAVEDAAPNLPDDVESPDTESTAH